MKIQNATFQTIVKRGNNRGAGFIAIPKELKSNFKIGEQLKVTINLNIVVYAKIRFYGTLGFYIPYEIMVENDLINRIVILEIKKLDGFYTHIGEDGRIYIPQKIAEEYILKQNDIVEIEGIVNGVKEIKYCIINFRARKHTTEYMCYFDYEKSNSKGIFRIVRKLPNNIQFFDKFFSGFHYGGIDDKKVILYKGECYPIIVNGNININEIAHYLGCYFSDGTKRGTHWGICASTFEQANYYYKMHQLLIKKSKIIPIISFTDTENNNEEELINYLKSIWKNNVVLLNDNVEVRIIKSQFKPSLKKHKFGCLVMKENRKLTQIYYNILLQKLFNEISLNKNKELAIDFLCGILEGDGSVGPKYRAHLVITSNKKELEMLKDIMHYSGIKCHLRMESKNNGFIRIGILEVIRNIGILKDKIFLYYPKRRKLLKERLANTASVKFLLGGKKKTSNWLIGQFNEMGILDGEGNLTEFGVKIQKDLKEFIS